MEQTKAAGETRQLLFPPILIDPVKRTYVTKPAYTPLEERCKEAESLYLMAVICSWFDTTVFHPLSDEHLKARTRKRHWETLHDRVTAIRQRESLDDVFFACM